VAALTGTMDPLYEDYLKAIQALMYQAHTLGLPRTRAALHQALDVARVEVWEIPPATFAARTPSVKFRIGPVSEQRT
jgi:hypothetical protein